VRINGAPAIASGERERAAVSLKLYEAAGVRFCGLSQKRGSNLFVKMNAATADLHMEKSNAMQRNARRGERRARR
jgi:hypothetical protein